MVSFPPCKINLGLQITRKRPDGYHDVVTCFYPVPWCDVLEMVPAASFTFSSSGIPVPGDPSDNLCTKAYALLKKEFALGPVDVYLLKILPIGAGLGGGSSDAAYALKMLNRLFDLKLPATDLKRFASRLGSDCAFFIDNKPMIGTGRGEILSEVTLPLKGKYLVIVTPDIPIQTSGAYAKITPRAPAVDLRGILENHPVTEWKEFLRNDFEEVLFPQYPVLPAIKRDLYASGAAYASMSGSGSAVYGLFENEVDIKEQFPAMTCWSGFLD